VAVAAAKKWYDEKGAPRVDTVRFPNMRGMVQKAHALGLRAGWYMGNYQCAAGVPNDVPTATLVKGSVRAIADFGFDSHAPVPSISCHSNFLL
jgi:hypothetical protein